MQFCKYIQESQEFPNYRRILDSCLSIIYWKDDRSLRNGYIKNKEFQCSNQPQIKKIFDVKEDMTSLELYCKVHRLGSQYYFYTYKNVMFIKLKMLIET